MNNKQQKGFIALEVILAATIFALAVVSIAWVLFTFLAGNDQSTYLPLLQRFQMETVAQQLDKDQNTYKLAFAYTGELDYDNSWVTAPTPLTYKANFPLSQVANATDFTNATENTIAPYHWSLVNTNSNNLSYTLLFVGTNGGVESVYQMTAQNVPIGINYTVQRIGPELDASSNWVYSVTQRVNFNAANNSSLASPDQPWPYFAAIDPLTIRVLLPNPFSQNMAQSVSSSSNAYYQKLTPLQFDLKMKGL
jgi:hypothetical protein